MSLQGASRSDFEFVGWSYEWENQPEQDILNVLVTVRNHSSRDRWIRKGSDILVDGVHFVCVSNLFMVPSGGEGVVLFRKFFSGDPVLEYVVLKWWDGEDEGEWEYGGPF